MNIIVQPHEIKILQDETVNEKEVNISDCVFEFPEEITDEFVKEVFFVKDNKTIKIELAAGNQCNYPPEILDSEGVCLLGVVATLTRNNELVKRYNPTPKRFVIDKGTLREADNSKPITPSEMEQYQQALNDGLNEVRERLNAVEQIGYDVQEKGIEAKKQGDYAKEQGDYAKETTDTLKESAENGNFDGATFKPNVDAEGNLSWTNDKGLENPATQNIKGDAALVNGVNTLKIVGGKNINIEQNSDTLKINNTYEYDDSEIKENTNTNTSNISKNKADIKAINDNLINYSLITETGSKIELSINPSDFKMKVILKDKDGNTIDTSNEIDLPLESMVIGASYDSDTKELVITLQNGTETRVPMSSLVDGLVNISDLDNYVKVTDYASNTKHGLIRGSSDKSWSVASNGTPYCSVRTLEIYNNMDPTSFISKGTLENIKDNYVETAKPIADINDYIDIITPKNTVKDSIVHIEDALPLPIFKKKIDGESKQNATNGYQLFDYNRFETFTQSGATVTNNGDGSFTISGAGNTTDMVINYIVLSHEESVALLHAGNIFLSINEFVSIYPFMSFRNSTGVIYEVNGSSSSHYQRNITQEMLDDPSFYIRFGFYSNRGVEIPNTTIKFIVYQDGDGTWEPFTGGIASPNTKYLQDIKVIEDKFNLEIRGKNLYYSDIDELDIVTTSGGWFYIDGTKGAYGTNLGNTKYKAFVKKGETYSFSVEASGYSAAQLVYSDESFISTANNNFTFTAKKDDYVIFRLYANYNSHLIVKNVQLEVGPLNTKFEPYKEQVVMMDLKDNFIGKLGEVADELLVDKKGNVSLNKYIFKKIFDGTENWFKSGLSTSSVFVIALDITNLNINFDYRMHFLSNHFKYDDTNIEKNKFRIYKGSSNDVFLGFGFDINEISTLSDAITWLTNNQLELEFVSNNVETIQLEKLADPIKTFEGINNIQVLANLDTEVEVKYALDIKKYIDRQNNLQDTQINEINILLSSTDTSAMLLDNYQNDLESEV